MLREKPDEWILKMWWLRFETFTAYLNGMVSLSAQYLNKFQNIRIWDRVTAVDRIWIREVFFGWTFMFYNLTVATKCYYGVTASDYPNGHVLAWSQMMTSHFTHSYFNALFGRILNFKIKNLNLISLSKSSVWWVANANHYNCLIWTCVTYF